MNTRVTGMLGTEKPIIQAAMSWIARAPLSSAVSNAGGMCKRILSSAESPVHNNWKQAILHADATDTVFLNRAGPGPALRALRTRRTDRIEAEGTPSMFGEFADTPAVYFCGDLEAGIALTGQVAGRIDAVKPVAQILAETMA